MNQNEMRMTLLYIHELWPNFTIPMDRDLRALREQAWMDVCGDLDPNVVRAALASLADREFPPSAGQLRTAALRQQSRENGRIEAPGADEAWLEFRMYYRDENHTWSHLAVESTAEVIGCRNFGDSPTSEEMAWRAQFIKLYGIAVDRIARQDWTPAPAITRRMETVEGPRQADFAAALPAGDEYPW